MTDQFTPLEQNVNVAHLLYQRHKSTPSSQQKRRSKSMFPSVKDTQALDISQLPSQQTQFVVTTLRPSNMVSTVDTRVVQAQNQAFDQHFKKQTQLSQDKSTRAKSSVEVVNPATIETVKKSPAGSLLDLKVIETWINDMLVEAEFNQADPKTKHAALKKYGIDRKTLRTKGLSQNDVDRVFRCLFVYSFGFYEMLMDILSHSIDASALMAQIWKVFGVLLEYCSRGDFQSTVNELEKEKKAQLDRMEQLLQEKEKQLQIIEVRERDRHAKLMEDVTHLQQQRDMLLIEKTQIEEDFKQADMAFNDEVALRLKFEYRINEIHGIHRDLVAKHNKLLDDMIIAKKQVERLEKELQSCKRSVELHTVDKRGLESEINNLRILLDNLQMAIKGKDQQIRELDVKVAVMRKQENKDYVDRKEFEHAQQTLQLQITNLEGALQSVQNREGELMHQIVELEGLKKVQSARILELDQEAQQYQRDYHETNSKLQSTLKMEKKLREQCESLRKEKLELERSREVILTEKRALEVDLQFMTQKADIQEREIAMLNQNVQQMKNIKSTLDDEYMRERLKVETLLGSVASKDDMIIELEKCLSYSQQRLHTVTTELHELELSTRLKEDELRVQVTSMLKKMDFMDICLMGERADLQAERERIAKVETDLDLARAESADLRQQLKSEVFERNNLQTKTVFMTRVIENEKQRNNELLAELTQMRIENESISRENKAFKVINQEQLQLSKEEIVHLRQKFERQIEEAKQHQKEMTYKIYYEDALSSILREQMELRQSREQNYKLYQILEERDQKVQKLEHDQEMLINKIEGFKVNTSELKQTNRQNTIKIIWMQMAIKALSNEYSNCLNEGEILSNDLSVARKQLDEMDIALDASNLEIEKLRILNKRLRKESLIDKAQRSYQKNSSQQARSNISADSDMKLQQEIQQQLNQSLEQAEEEEQREEDDSNLNKSQMVVTTNSNNNQFRITQGKSKNLNMDDSTQPSNFQVTQFNQLQKNSQLQNDKNLYDEGGNLIGRYQGTETNRAGFIKREGRFTQRRKNSLHRNEAQEDDVMDFDQSFQISTQNKTQKSRREKLSSMNLNQNDLSQNIGSLGEASRVSTPNQPDNNESQLKLPLRQEEDDKQSKQFTPHSPSNHISANKSMQQASNGFTDYVKNQQEKKISVRKANNNTQKNLNNERRQSNQPLSSENSNSYFNSQQMGQNVLQRDTPGAGNSNSSSRQPSSSYGYGTIIDKPKSKQKKNEEANELKKSSKSSSKPQTSDRNSSQDGRERRQLTISRGGTAQNINQNDVSNISNSNQQNSSAGSMSNISVERNNQERSQQDRSFQDKSYSEKAAIPDRDSKLSKITENSQGSKASSRQTSRERRNRQDLREFGRLYQIASTHYQV